MKLHTGDTVVVITGKDKGKTGTILRVLPAEHRVVVGGVNMRTRHVKKTFQQAGRIVKFEASLHASNVMIVDPKSKKRSRIGYKLEKGKKIRISKESGEAVAKVRPKAEKKTAAKKAEGAEAKKPTAPSEDAGKSPAKSTPFWKRMGFGAAAGETVEAPDEARSKQDHSIPDPQIHKRGGSRGS